MPTQHPDLIETSSSDNDTDHDHHAPEQLGVPAIEWNRLLCPIRGKDEYPKDRQIDTRDNHDDREHKVNRQQHRVSASPLLMIKKVHNETSSKQKSYRATNQTAIKTAIRT